MTPIPATLDVSFVSNFTGQHRVCWRIPPAIPYDCSTVVTCLGGGATCVANIPILVDNEACLPVTYEGYVQAACEDIASLNGRIPFSITFTPVPDCASYRVTCNSVSVASVTVTAPGSGYDPLNPPGVTISLGGGAGATATAVVGSTITITNPGSGYAPDGLYVNVPLINIVGTGIGAQATVVVTGGSVTSVVITTSGTGYFPGDTFTFNDSDLGNSGLGSGVAVGFNAGYGTVTSITLNTPGAGYTSVPAVTIPSPVGGGTDALATAVLDDCPDQILGLSCDGSPAQTVVDLPLNQSAINCMQLPLPVAEPGVTFTPEACCYDCIQVTFSVPLISAAADVYYTDCVTHNIVTVNILPGASTGVICAVNNSWYYSPNAATVNVVTGGVCS